MSDEKAPFRRARGIGFGSPRRDAWRLVSLSTNLLVEKP